MRVAILALAGLWGGTQIHTVNLARMLKARGHSTTIVCSEEAVFQAYRDHCDDVALILSSLPTELRSMTFSAWWRYFAGQPWDVCVLVKGDIDAGDWRLDLAARLRFGNYITIEHLMADASPRTRRLHFGFVPALGLWWYRARLRRFFRSVGPRRVICVSEAVRRRLITDYRFPAPKALTVQNGIDVHCFRPDPVQREIWRRRWNIDPGAIVFGAVGRFHPRKGYHTALAGFQVILRRFPDKDLRLVLVGEGQHEDVLKARAGQIRPTGRVTFWPFCDRPWEPLAALDVFLMPSLNEGMPLALLEAMACGCCPVASAVGGVPEVLESSRLGWLVPAADDVAFAAAMADAVSRTLDERRAMGEHGRRHVVDRFNMQTQFGRLVDVLESSTRPRMATTSASTRR